MNYPTTDVEEVKLTSKPLIGSVGIDFSMNDHERFKAKFGVTVQNCTHVWNMIVSKLNRTTIEPGFGRLTVVHILYALFFLKMYPTSRQATATLGRNVGRNQFQKYAQFLIRKIAGLSNEVVSKKRFDLINFFFYFIS